MGKVKEEVTAKAEALMIITGASLEEATQQVMDRMEDLYSDMERIDYSDTPPEMGMAGDYEDHDAETAEVLKHIVGE
jgi:hypothetical protein